MRIKSTVYKLLRISNDINAIKKGKVGKRFSRRVYGRTSSKLMRKLFK